MAWSLPKLPRAAIGIALLALGLAIYALSVGLWPLITALFSVLVVGGEFDESGWRLDRLLAWVPLGVFGLLAVLRLLRCKPQGPGWTFSFLIIALGMLLPQLTSHADDVWNNLGMPPPSPVEIVINHTGKDVPITLTFLFALALVAWFGKILLFEPTTRLACNAPLETEEGIPARRRPFVSFLLALCIWMFFPHLIALVSILLDASLRNGWAWSWVGLLPDVLEGLPFVAAVGLLFARRTERILIDADGIALFVFRRRFSLFRPNWKRVRFFDVIRHGSRPPTFVVHYRARLGFPMSAGIHPDRYGDPEAIVQAIDELISRNGVKSRTWNSPPAVLVAGAVAMVTAAAFIWYGRVLSNTLAQQYTDGIISPYDISRFAGLRPLTSVYLAACACLGLGFGLHSAFHRGGPRPVLLLLLLAGVDYVPHPLIHWLVAMAMFAIMTAATGVPIYLHPPQLPVPTSPSLAEWELYLGLVKFSPVAVGVAYILGVIFGGWPWRLLCYPRSSKASPRL